MIRLLVCGSRNWTDRTTMKEEIVKCNPSVIIQGKARGADRMSEEIAVELGIEVEGYAAEWNVYGKRAGPIRNQRMLDEGKPDKALAFPLPGSIGTWDMVRRARAARIEVKIIEKTA